MMRVGNSNVKSRTKSASPVSMNSSIKASQTGRTMVGSHRASALDLNAADTRLRWSRCFFPPIARMVGPMKRPIVLSYGAELNTRPSRNTVFTASNDTAEYSRFGRLGVVHDRPAEHAGPPPLMSEVRVGITQADGLVTRLNVGRHLGLQH